jgi:hypothetical protein
MQIMQKFELSLNNTNKVIHSRAPLDSTTIDPKTRSPKHYVTRFNSANVLNEGLRIGEIGHRMNSKVKLVEIGVYRK